MKIYGNTHKGLVRNSNQDNFYIDQSGEWCLVADGMGGHKGGETASALAVSSIKSYLSQNNGDTEDILRTAIVKANNEVFEHSLKVPELDGMGTTVVLLKMENNIAFIAHVGDSRAYLIRDDKMNQVTEDHTYVNELVKNGIITEEEGERHPKRNIITRALGGDALVEPDIFRIGIKKDDVLLLCTDGLYNEVSEDKIVSIISEADSMTDACRLLVNAANRSGGRDNITVICLKI